MDSELQTMTKTAVVDLRDGRYVIRYLVKHPGTYSLEVEIDSIPLCSGPLRIHTAPQALSPQHCRLDLTGKNHPFLLSLCLPSD